MRVLPNDRSVMNISNDISVWTFSIDIRVGPYPMRVLPNDRSVMNFSNDISVWTFSIESFPLTSDWVFFQGQSGAFSIDIIVGLFVNVSPFPMTAM